MPASLAPPAGLASVTLSGLPIVRQIQLLTPAGRPASLAQQAVIASLQSHGWGGARAQSHEAALRRDEPSAPRQLRHCAIPWTVDRR